MLSTLNDQRLALIWQLLRDIYSSKADDEGFYEFSWLPIGTKLTYKTIGAILNELQKAASLDVEAKVLLPDINKPQHPAKEVKIVQKLDKEIPTYMQAPAAGLWIKVDEVHLQKIKSELLKQWKKRGKLGYDNFINAENQTVKIREAIKELASKHKLEAFMVREESTWSNEGMNFPAVLIDLVDQGYVRIINFSEQSNGLWLAWLELKPKGQLEIMSKKWLNSVRFVLNKNTKNQIVVNEKYVLTKLHFLGSNDEAFEYFLKNENKVIQKKDLPTEASNNLSKIRADMNLHKKLTPVFFPKSGSNGVIFRSKAKRRDLLKAGINEKEILDYLEENFTC